MDSFFDVSLEFFGLEANGQKEDDATHVKFCCTWLPEEAEGF